MHRDAPHASSPQTSIHETDGDRRTSDVLFGLLAAAIDRVGTGAPAETPSWLGSSWPEA